MKKVLFSIIIYAILSRLQIHFYLILLGKILVHCFMGISRSASLILAYLIRHRKMKLNEAIRIVARKRLIWPNEGFLGKLIQYQNYINK